MSVKKRLRSEKVLAVKVLSVMRFRGEDLGRALSAEQASRCPVCGRPKKCPCCGEPMPMDLTPIWRWPINPQVIC